jgi:2-methylisocitrate lyase-like PEP mutase family enzyme
VVEAGFPVVATTSWGVAVTLGYEDDERAPGDEMLAWAARIVRSVDVPVTVDAEAGYKLRPAEIVALLHEIGAAGCNLEDTAWPSETLRNVDQHAAWLREIREAATAIDYPLVINARVDVFFHPFLADEGGAQGGLVSEAVERANAYLDAGADCVYPICIWEMQAIRDVVDGVEGAVNVCRMPTGPTVSQLADAGIARVSWGPFLQWDSIARFREQIGSLD